MNLESIAVQRARRHHMDFMRFMWQRKDPMVIGTHTKAICERLDRAIEDYSNGISTYLLIKCCHRQGKSEIVSRYLPANFIGKFPDDEIIVSGHSAKLVYKFSRFARRLVRDRRFQKVHPGITLSDEVSNVAEWGIDDYMALTQWIGLGGGLSGTGGNLIVLDDFFKNRGEAESETVRDSRWDAVTDDLMTRMAPVCIFCCLATPWHTDDVFARIEKRMKEDPDFPRFEEMKFPAYSMDYPNAVKGETPEDDKPGTLFPERFSPEWYSGQMAQLGSYSAAGLMLCEPKVRGGNFLAVDRIKIVTGLDDPNLPEVFRQTPRFARAWDLASSKKERAKDDPDWSIGVKGAVKKIPSAIKDVSTTLMYIDDVIRGQWEGTRRNEVIRDSAIGDGEIPVGIEAFGPYKDAYTAMKEILKGIRSVRKMQLPGDKVAKMDPLVPIIEAGNFYIKEASWNKPYLKVMGEFPNGKHDDDPDATAVLHGMMVKSLQIFT